MASGDEYAKKFMLHYNFPPFSTGEVKRIMGPGRREIGHGALAERSLEAVLPTPDVFPYVVRLVCDVMESNGSSSMASVCSGTLALLDAGVPIIRPVAGISIGLVKEGNREELITDIIGEEDHYGDMDFKVSGTTEGVTGIQLDLKIRGLSFDIIEKTFVRAKEARLFILGEMAKTLSHAPRSNFHLRSAPAHRAHQPGEDRQDHRTGRQDDQVDRRTHRRQDRYRG